VTGLFFFGAPYRMVKDIRLVDRPVFAVTIVCRWAAKGSRIAGYP
jgi:hypothetical protein